MGERVTTVKPPGMENPVGQSHKLENNLLWEV